MFGCFSVFLWPCNPPESFANSYNHILMKMLGSRTQTIWNYLLLKYLFALKHKLNLHLFSGTRTLAEINCDLLLDVISFEKKNELL